MITAEDPLVKEHAKFLKIMIIILFNLYCPLYFCQNAGLKKIISTNHFSSGASQSDASSPTRIPTKKPNLNVKTSSYKSDNKEQEGPTAASPAKSDGAAQTSLQRH